MILQMSKVSVGFSQTDSQNALLSNIDLCVESHRTTILLGASGSGKTLCMSAIQGLIPSNLTLQSGEILLDGKPLDSHNARSKVFASIMQNPRTCFNPLWTMRSHFKESLDVLKKPYNPAQIESLLQEVGLEKDVLDCYAFELSGGMLQRVMIALGLLYNAPFLLADEPTSDLDTLTQNKILSLLESLQEARGFGMLLITHDLNIAAQKADRIYLIAQGKIHEMLDARLFKRENLQEILIEKLSKLQGGIYASHI
ncbi:ATP-binding cassette domain-containing protein [Helicobacter sp. MIT 05-5293]|uniref:ATP-binding cassette domain-containing protein n=1 Tax=Helicobacter sp. MIT 05-5293 TaxID=1548149 RepID=UPI0010FE7829|nr:ATP-binding cassette domain-containing protein [Helicobacter sp. MIT 05-5293]TLD80481.1 ATP-binding cassette domain-containing protein [Helicobacter sp. MIT 05-5293]